jgi:hypothetical protein
MLHRNHLNHYCRLTMPAFLTSYLTIFSGTTIRLTSLFKCTAIFLIFGTFASVNIQPVAAQSTAVSFVQDFQQVQQQLPRERIHIHTDRQWYVEGDVIWFSAYVAQGPTRRRGSLGTKLYVELIDPTGSVSERATIELQNGRSSGLLRTGRGELAHGPHTIRAYTAWALNFGDSYISETPIHVFANAEVEAAAASSRATRWRRLLNRDSDETQSDPSRSSELPSIDLQFLPEGGTLLANVPSRIAFKALDSDGRGAHITGTIFSSEGDIIPFASEHRGMGFVTLTPKSGVTYFAQVNEMRYELPAVAQSGVSLSVETSPEYADVKIWHRGAERVSELVLFAHVRGEVYVAARIIMDESGYGEVRLSSNIISTGIVHYTVLYPDGTPAAERLAFNRNAFDLVQVEAEVPQALGKRERGELSLKLTNSENLPIAASVSVSVFDDEIFAWDAWHTTIATRFNLESELRGTVEAPGYYFSDAAEADHHLDLLMMTQGWRSYQLPEIHRIARSQSTFVPEYQPEFGFNMEGTLLSRFRRRPVSGAIGALSRGDNYEDLQVFTTDRAGRFQLNDLPVNGREAMNIRATRSNGRGQVWIELDTPTRLLSQQRTPPMANPPRPVALEQDFQGVPVELLTRSATTRASIYAAIDISIFGELDEVIVTADREPPDSFEQSLRTGNRPSQRVDMNQSAHLQDLPLSQVINQLNGVSMTEQQGLTLNTGFVGNFGAVPQPMIIIDGIVVDESALWMVETSDVHSLNVFRRSSEAAFWGARSGGGVIVVHTRSGEPGPPRDGLGYLTKILEGFQPYQQFYTPMYALAQDRASQTRDGRITLYWNPLLNVMPAGSTVGFWTGDVETTFRVVVEGLTTEGVPFVYTTRFDVD